MKKMYTVFIIITVYLITGAIAWLRGPLIFSAKIKSIYPYYLSPVVWIKHYEPSEKTSDTAIKLGSGERGVYKINIITGSWEKIEVTKAVSVTGKAQNVKHGAELLTESQGPVLIDGLRAWPNEKIGKMLTVQGKELIYKETVPSVSTDENGLTSQGSETTIEQWVLVDAKLE